MDVLLGRDDYMDENEYLHINYTCVPSLGLTVARDAESAINVLITLIGGPMNLIVLTTQLLSNRIYRSSTPTLYMTNLYFANLLTVLTIPFLILSNRGYISSSPEGCKIVALAYYSTCTAGFATLALIAINRYRVIHTRTRQAAGSKKQTYCVLAITWLTSLMCASPAPLYATVMAHDTDTDTVHETCIIFFSYEQVKSVLATFKILICIIWGVTPVIMMTWFYTFFYKRLKLTSYRRRSHTLTFVSTLILSFLIVQSPFVAIMIFDSYAVIQWEITCESINIRDSVGMLARVVPNFHCMLNPVLYAFLGRDFNKRFKQCLSGKLFSRRQMLRERAGIKVAGHISSHAPSKTSTLPQATRTEAPGRRIARVSR
uniref:Envelope glycoprotein UL33 n=1 Tax=Mastomys natalensis cytomegalovirus 2 TaxID=2973540 RepID=A0A9Y1IR56_9BETA|nr:envelope glycoprotein UL33 [Mastomys natalensis cytomegalovirus 2]WEG69174.1 envelope glycoprotein UL33 [Mastomys natalensis cytomegalovirus 2]WEG69313.1 envelope glycoprotein UL33 [Mastomys natalensis cytomegalovirus 2]WEG69451.1 envelope glycoprotein UL33 [Mastomys natalensis cytomegalovirus 2]WEG69589.1 envelope glycoprotein UL33 [Mastomys natalensis cytomegalovirus 2]